MITRFTSIEEMKQLFFELLFNHTNKVTKIANEGVVNGIAYGVAKVAQKANKEIALVESHLFPEYAFGHHLDVIAERNGVAPRFGPSQSTAYVRLVAQPGTSYAAADTVLSGNGIEFKLDTSVTVGEAGYVYARVRSQTSGERTNVPPLTINKISPKPQGHRWLANEFSAQGGRDYESDIHFKNRIRKALNVFSKQTLDYITCILQMFNEDVLFVKSKGMDDSGKFVLYVVLQNGGLLTEDEIEVLVTNLAPYMSISDFDYVNNTVLNLKLENVEWKYIDISFRAEFVLEQPLDQTRIELQASLSRALDFTNHTGKVEWDDLLQIVKNHPMVKYVSDKHFSPGEDVEISSTMLPRIRGFIMMDLEGNVLVDNNNVLNPVYYPNTPDFAFQQTVL